VRFEGVKRKTYMSCAWPPRNQRLQTESPLFITMKGTLNLALLTGFLLLGEK